MSRDDLDALLDAIGPANGPDAELDERWEQLAAGELSETEAQALRAAAATSARGADLVELFEPLEDDVLARTAARLDAMRPEQPAPLSTEAKAPWHVPETEAAPAPPPGPSLMDQVRAWLRPLVVVPLLVAAMAMVVLLPTGGGLPTYQVEMRSGDQAMRGDERAEEVVHAPGSRFEVLLRTEAGPTDVAVTGRLGDLGLTVTAEASDNGTLLVRGQVPNDAPAGPTTLALTVSSGGGQASVDVPFEVSAH